MINATQVLGFDADEVDEQFVNELLYSASADGSETAGENGIYLDDQLNRKGARLTVRWTFKGSALVRHSNGRQYMVSTSELAGSSWTV